MKRFAPFSPGSSSAGAPALRLTLVGLLFSLFLTCTAGAVEPVELSGRFGIRAVNCFYPGPHDNHVDYVLVEEGTQRLIRLVGDEEVFGGVKPDQQVRINGLTASAPEPGSSAETTDGQVAASPTYQTMEVQVESVESVEVETAEPAIEGGKAAGSGADGANSLEMLSCLLIFASTNTNDSMTEITNARNLLFDNPTNANEGMQAVTKGRFGLQLGDGTGEPEDHIIEVNLDVDSADVEGTFAMESLIRSAVFGTGPGELGIDQFAYDRILIFPPGGYPDGSGGRLDRANFTAYAYIYWPVGSGGSGRVSVYGQSYGNSRMNGYVHELGHNFGFRHSTKTGASSEYKDRTCVMGTSNDETRTETYNAVKLMSTDWLDAFAGAGVALTQDATIDLYPLSSDLETVEETVAVSISGTDYYVAYHRNDEPYGYLSQSEDHDKVFVYTNTDSDSLSYQDANLAEGDRYEKDVVISFDFYGANEAYAKVSFDLDDGNSRPQAVPRTFATEVDNPVGIPLAGSDPDEDAITFSIVSDPLNGSLSGDLPNVIYTPDADFTGDDSFVYEVNDGAISAFATITIGVGSDTEADDSDGDGLPDEWELLYFDDLDESGTGDPDGDGDDNLTEFTNGTDPTEPPAPPISRPTGLNANATNASVSLDWDDSADAKFASFTVYRSTTSGVYTSALATDLPSSEYTDSTALNDVTYYYVVVAVDTEGNESAFSEEEAATPSDFVQSPSGLEATPDDAEVDLDWENSADENFASYTVYRREVSGQYTTPLATGLTVSNYTDTSAENGTTYYYVVRTVTSAEGESANSNEVYARPSPAGVDPIFVSANAFYSGERNGDESHALSLRDDSGYGSGDDVAYLRFDVSGINPADITSAVLELSLASTGPSGGNDRIQIWGLEDAANYGILSESTWTADNLTGSNAPHGSMEPGSGNDNLSPYLAYYSGYAGLASGTILPVDLDLAEFQNLVAADTNGEITLVLTGGIRADTRIGSLYNAGTRAVPTLVIDSVSPGAADSDSDGMPDSWEIEQFGDTSRPAAGDFDNDGVSNLFERAFGLESSDDAQGGLPVVASVEEGDKEYMSITYRRLKGGSGTTGVNYSVDGISYQVEYASDLTDPWSRGNVVQVGTTIDNGDGTETVTVRLISPVEESATQFMRLNVDPVP